MNEFYEIVIKKQSAPNCALNAEKLGIKLTRRDKRNKKLATQSDYGEMGRWILILSFFSNYCNKMCLVAFVDTQSPPM